MISWGLDPQFRVGVLACSRSHVGTTRMGLLNPFEGLEDPRSDRNKRYPLDSLMWLKLTDVLSDCQGPTEIFHFGVAKLEWFKRHKHFVDGLAPSHDVIGNLLKRLDPEAFADCFARWKARMCEITQGELVAIDGKLLRGSYERFDGKEAIHMISAWSHQNQLLLGQLKVDGKNNGITAIPALLALLDLAGAVVSIDAMSHAAKALWRRRGLPEGDRRIDP